MNERWVDLTYSEIYCISDCFTTKGLSGDDREIAKDLWIKLAPYLEERKGANLALSHNEMWLIVLCVPEHFSLGGKPVGAELKVKLLAKLRGIELEKSVRVPLGTAEEMPKEEVKRLLGEVDYADTSKNRANSRTDSDAENRPEQKT